ncbi:MAG TPA: hypothetical protein VGO80_20790 [Solirubrobacteraceae bacterium]|jgi:hypothetical protein|nr:hypothetical protein [Solirubrobacteraceae bacterium]
MDLDELTRAAFAPLVGDAFTIAAEPASIEFTLESATTLGSRPGGRDPFSLLFRGPREPLLAQAIYRLEHAVLGPLEIFIVPLGQDAQTTRYEAIFT